MNRENLRREKEKDVASGWRSLRNPRARFCLRDGTGEWA